jgi:hypothetical protein
MAAMLALTITLTAMSSGFLRENLTNIKAKILRGGMSVSTDILNDLRRQPVNTITLGLETSSKDFVTTSYDNSGNSKATTFTYDVQRYVCTQKPTIISGGSVTCSTTVNPSNSLRYVFIRVKRDNEEIYSVETAFTSLR